MSLAQRNLLGELMDDPTLMPDAHHAALHGLQRINAISRTATSIWPSIARALAACHDANASLLDVACGGGDVTVALAQRACRDGFALTVQGCDISDTALEHASTLAAQSHQQVTFFRADVLSDALPRHYACITCTLFLHHLNDAQIVLLLRKLAAHTDHLIVSDLVRGRLGYALAWLGTRAFSRSFVVHEDGLRSVRAALTLPEARALSDAAGLRNVRFERRWPQRFVMTWSRED